jgi:hypothetical protein
MSVDIYRNLSTHGGFNVIITHVPTATTVEFPGFVTAYSDTISPEFGQIMIYGRMDPIKTYKGTTRKVTVSFDVVAESLDIGKLNMQNFALLSRMMYPKFSKIDGAETMSLKAPPLLQIRYANLIKDANSEAGLLCAANSIEFKPSFEHGFFAPSDESGTLYAKKYDLNLTLEVLHTHQIGWGDDNKWLSADSWPHNIDAAGAANAAPPASNSDSDTSNAVNFARTSLMMGTTDGG